MILLEAVTEPFSFFLVFLGVMDIQHSDTHFSPHPRNSGPHAISSGKPTLPQVGKAQDESPGLQSREQASFKSIL